MTTKNSDQLQETPQGKDQTMATKADELRQQAAERDQAARDSFERCDTDGFLSQWASGLTARLLRRQADIEEQGGMATFPGLFDGHGRRIKAKVVVQPDRFRGYGEKETWLVLDGDDRPLAWVNRAGHLRTGKPPHPQSKMAKMGLREGWEDAPAKAYMDGRGTGLSGTAWVAVKRLDGGYPSDAIVYGEEVVV